MKKEVLVSISGTQMEVSDEPTTVLLPGEYYKRNNTHYVKYQQYDEESNQLVNSMIKVKGKTVELQKTGYHNVRMCFEEDHNFTSYYDMKQGCMLMETRTGNVIVEEAEDSMKVELEYELYMNEQYISECKVVINIAERSGGQKA